LNSGALPNEACRTSDSSPEMPLGEVGYLTRSPNHTTNRLLVNIKSIELVDFVIVVECHCMRSDFKPLTCGNACSGFINGQETEMPRTGRHVAAWGANPRYL
jgi:hypothetical protein